MEDLAGAFAVEGLVLTLALVVSMRPLSVLAFVVVVVAVAAVLEVPLGFRLLLGSVCETFFFFARSVPPSGVSFLELCGLI